jgi:hypothetical protein
MFSERMSEAEALFDTSRVHSRNLGPRIGRLTTENQVLGDVLEEYFHGRDDPLTLDDCSPNAAPINRQVHYRSRKKYQ